MKQRWVLHAAYWLAFWWIYAYTYSRYDGHVVKYLLSEGMQMPARMLATYGAFWSLDRLNNRQGNVWPAFAGAALANVAGGLLNRLFKLWYIVPTYFPDSTIAFWDWRAMVDIFDCVLASGVALTVRLFYRQQDLLRREAVLREEKTAAELQALKNQIHPHFLFNTINNLYALARMKSDKTAPVALQLAHLLRFVLYETRKPSIPVEQEVQVLKDYVALERLRYDEDRLSVEMHINLDDPKQPITPLLLLPLVENAFKHGAGEHRTDAWVRLSVVLNNKILDVRVENSVDPQFEAADPGNGIGLQNVRRQLELIYPGKNDLSAGVEYEAGNRFFRAQLRLELDKFPAL
ncbi:MAG: histidine kinase [Saprospiraceae bacterium]|nr:histidine kinase [Saprospiraceae bacterium]